VIKRPIAHLPRLEFLGAVYRSIFFSQTAVGEHKAVSQFAKGQCGTQRNAAISFKRMRSSSKPGMPDGD
jgi:hypothetical protein